MSLTVGLLLAICAIMLGVRLPALLRRQGVPKKDRILVVFGMFVLLAFAFFASGAVGQLLALFRA